jgi:hypothetical protein
MGRMPDIFYIRVGQKELEKRLPHECIVNLSDIDWNWLALNDVTPIVKEALPLTVEVYTEYFREGLNHGLVLRTDLSVHNGDRYDIYKKILAKMECKDQ